MCGIIGGVAHRDVLPVLVDGLKRLEYRGYDSAGVAVLDEQQSLHRLRVVGKVQALLARLAVGRDLAGDTGVAHTRWATHGEPSEVNAHPHVCRNEIALVHNGIIENHEALRSEVLDSGYVLDSQTDSELIACLIHQQLSEQGDLCLAVRRILPRLRGAYALGVIQRSAPRRMVAVRCGSPLVLGLGSNERFIASDMAALLPITRSFIVLEEGDVADITPEQHTLYARGESVVVRQQTQSGQDPVGFGRDGYRHFMQKEIFTQPQALRDTLAGPLADGQNGMDGWFGADAPALFSKTRALHLVACGTSFHAALVARHWLEEFAGLPCSVDVASEYRHRRTVTPDRCLFVCISQSGETADTLAALEKAHQLPYLARLAICNVPESSLTRMADLVFLTRAGVEIGVASTKAFTTQLAGLFLLVLILARRNGGLDDERYAALVRGLAALPERIAEVLSRQEQLQTMAEDFVHCQNVLYIGRGLLLPIAMEGGLKLKELSYIHAEAYPGGELKHGPLALVDDAMQVVALAGHDVLLAKMRSNLAEIHSRGGRIYLFSDDDEPGAAAGLSCAGLHQLPHSQPCLSPFSYAVALQLLAYHVAVLRGADVDQPRNLAKSVTVE